MEEIKAAVGEDNSISFCLEVLNNPPEIFSFFDLFSHLQLLFKNYQI